jgi:hypothetical protein
LVCWTGTRRGGEQPAYSWAKPPKVPDFGWAHWRRQAAEKGFQKKQVAEKGFQKKQVAEKGFLKKQVAGTGLGKRQDSGWGYQKKRVAEKALSSVSL